MSSIHKALRKAQREKDNQHQEYDGVLTAQGGKRVFSSKPVLLGSLLIVVVLCALIFYLWFEPRNMTTSQEKQKPGQEDVSTLVKEKPVSPSFQKQPVKAQIKKRQVPSHGSDKGLLSGAENIKQTYDKARSFQKIGRLNDAKRLYHKVLKADPDFTDALNTLGVILMVEKNYKAAQANFEKASRLEPKNVDPQYNLACVHALNGKIRQGLLHLKKACLLDKAARDWARTDADLANLRKMPEFENIIRME